MHNVTIDFVEDLCGGTAPFFVPSGQGNTSAEVNGLLVKGGGASFRMGVPGSVRGLKIVDRSWYYSAVDVKCSALSFWEAQRVTIDANYKVTGTRGSPALLGSRGLAGASPGVAPPPASRIASRPGTARRRSAPARARADT